MPNPSGWSNQTFDLFIELGATDEQADFPIIYTQATSARPVLHLNSARPQPLFPDHPEATSTPKVDMDAATANCWSHPWVRMIRG